jgi:hypothetical protein
MAYLRALVRVDARFEQLTARRQLLSPVGDNYFCR